jgi:hypothetical protein
MVFAPGIISTGDLFASAFSPDGRRYLFFTRAVVRPGAPPERDIHVVRFDALLRRIGADRPPAS